MTADQIRKIADLTPAGWRQKEIASELGLHRNRVYYWQKKMGLSLDHPGIPCPALTESQEKKVLELLETGAGTVRISKELGLRERAVRNFAKNNHFRHKRGPGQRYRLSPAKRAKILDEIINHRNPALTIAHKYSVSYKLVLRMARAALNCERFRCGYGRPPLASHFPQKDYRKVKQR
jgi:transposase